MKTKPESKRGVYAYPINTHHGSFAIRQWDADKGKFRYWSTDYSKERGHVLIWSYSSDRAWTMTGLLSAMFTAQQIAENTQDNELAHAIEVVRLDEPVIWSTHYTNRPLLLGIFPPGTGAAKAYNKQIIADIKRYLAGKPAKKHVQKRVKTKTN